MKFRVTFTGVLLLVAGLGSTGAQADCVADQGDPTDIEADGVTVSCDTADPNPFTSGVGSTRTDTNLTVDIATDAGIDTSDVGVTLAGGGSLTNAGTITSSANAVTVTDTQGTGTPEVDNTGSIISTGAAGIEIGPAFGDATVDNSGSISASSAGIRLGTGTVSNSGTINSSTVGGVAIEASGSLTVTNSGSIASSGDGVRLAGGGSLDNSGDITASAVAASLDSGASLTNSGTITSNSGTAVIVSGNSTLVNSGTISGSGTAIEMSGGNNTLTLQSGSSIAGDIRSLFAGTPSDSLILEGQGSAAGAIENFASLIMRGNTWTLSGIVATEALTLESGRLNIDGTLDMRRIGTGQLSLTQGTLGGVGTILADVSNTSGTLSPGNTTGTLTIDGNYSQGTNGQLQVSSNAGSGVGLLRVTGTADLAGTVRIQAGSDGIYDFLTADGGISGEFDEVVVDGRALVTVLPTENTLRFVRASTTVEDNMVFAMLDAAVLTLDGLQTGGRSAGDSGVWLKPVGHWGEKEEEDGVPGGDFWIYGAMGGMDWSFAGDRWRVGLGGGYTTTDLDIDDGGEGEADNTVFGAYLEYVTPRFHGSLTLSGGSNEFEHERSIFVNNVRNRAEADYDGDTVAVRLAFGGNLPLEGEWKDNWLFEPEVRADYIVIDLDPFVEDGGTGLEVEATDDIEAAEFAGLFHVRRTSSQGLGMAPRMHIGVVHRIAIDDREWSASDAASGVSFLLSGDDQESTYFRFGIGADIDLGSRWKGYVDYLGEVGDGGQGHSLVAGIKLRF